MDLGLIGHGSSKETYFGLLNLNPLPIAINDWKISYHKAELHYLGTEREYFSMRDDIVRKIPKDYDKSSLVRYSQNFLMVVISMVVMLCILLIVNLYYFCSPLFVLDNLQYLDSELMLQIMIQTH